MSKSKSKLEIDVNSQKSGKHAVRAIKKAINSARDILHGIDHPSPAPVVVEIRTNEMSTHQQSEWKDISPGKFPVKSVERKYVEIGYDFGHEHGGWNKVEIHGLEKIIVGIPEHTRMSSDCPWIYE